MLMQSLTTCVELVVDLVPTQAVVHISMPTTRTSPLFHTQTWTSMTANATLAVETLRTTRMSIKYSIIPYTFQTLVYHTLSEIKVFQKVCN